MQTAKSFGELTNYSVYTLNRKWGLAGTPYGGVEQQILTQPRYDLIYPFVKGHAVVKIGDLYGIIDKYGKETIPVRYKYLSPDWYNNCVYVSDNYGGDASWLNFNNMKIDHPCGFQTIERIILSQLQTTNSGLMIFSSDNPDIFTFENDNVGGVFNKRINKIIYRNRGSVSVVNRDKIIVQEDGTNKYGIIDVYGRVLVPCIYDSLIYSATQDKSIDENLIKAEKNGRFGYIDFTGTTIIPFSYKLCGTFVSGRAWVSNDQYKCGIIDRYGRIIEPLVHDDITVLDDGTMILQDISAFGQTYCIFGKPKDYVKYKRTYSSYHFEVFHKSDFVGVQTSQRKKGICHLDGREVLPAIYDDILFYQTVSKGVIVKLNNKTGIVDLSNKTLVPFEYDGINGVEVRKNGVKPIYYIVHKNRKCGVLDDDFRVCIPVIYDSLDYAESYNGFIVEINRERAMVDLQNDIMMPFTNAYIKK